MSTAAEQIKLLVKEVIEENARNAEIRQIRQIKPLVKEALKEVIEEYARNAASLVGIVDSVRTATYIIDHLPIARGMSHQQLRSEALKDAPAGACFEFGVFKAFWLRFMAEQVPDRLFYGFDSFEGLPDDWANLKKGHFDLQGQLPEVPKNVTLIKGWFDQTLPVFLAQHPDEKAAFIHMDCDLYSSTMTVLLLIKNRLQVGTRIVLDDFMLEPGWRKQEHKAFFDFCEACGIKYEITGYSDESPTVSASIRLVKV